MFWVQGKKIFLAAIGILLCLVLFNPNPFGNNPDAVADESYFLTSSLSAIKKHTLPGLEFSASGSFYGGVQAYLDTLTLVPVLGSVFLKTGSFTETSVRVALQTGDLIHWLRLLNGFLVGLMILGLFYLNYKNNWSRELKFFLLLFGLILFGNSLFVGMIHTAKVWALYCILEIVLGLTVIIQAYTTETGKPWLTRPTFVAIIFWLFILICLQNVVGLTTGLWLIYSLMLGLASFKDLWPFIKKQGIFVLLVFALNASFLYRSFTMYTDQNNLYRLNDIAGSLTTTRDEVIDLGLRLWHPLELVVKSQPAFILYLLAISLVGVRFWRTKQKVNKLTAIALLHPIFVYTIIHGIFGLSTFPRYILPLSIALNFSLVILIKDYTWFKKPSIALATLILIFVNYHIVRLYWQRSTEKVLNQKIAQELNYEDTLIIMDGTAGRLQLPMNSRSLDLLNTQQKQMERFKFLLTQKNLIDSSVSFKPLVAYVGPDRDISAIMTSSTAREVWVVSSAADPTVKDAPAHEVTTIPDLWRTKRLGSIYILEKLK